MGFKKDFSKIHDNVDVVRVANEIKPCGVKNLSSTESFLFVFYNSVVGDEGFGTWTLLLEAFRQIRKCQLKLKDSWHISLV